MLLDLLIIHPGAVHGIYGSDLAESLIAVEQPLWCRLIAGYILDRGFTVKIIDQEALQLASSTIAAQVKELNPRLVAIAVYGHQPSASTQQMTGARAIAQEIKKLIADQCIIMTGNHPSALPEQTLREEPVDYVCDGEGPITIEGLLRGNSLSEIPGLVWHSLVPRSIIQNLRATLLNFDDLHGNVWRLLPMNRYRSHNWQAFGNLADRQPYAAIYTSLGCPFKCNFCMINVFQHQHTYRRRPPTSVIAEIATLYTQYGVRTFKIVDELFVLNRTHYRAICNGLASMDFKDDINIWAYARTDTIHLEDLPLMRKAGIRWLALGIESGSSKVREGSNKALRGDFDSGNETIAKIVRAIQAADINVIGNYIFGLRDDDTDSMNATLNLAMDLNTEFANFYSAMAYPGSALYDQAIAEGWTLPDTWAGYSQHNRYCRPLDTKYVSAAEVLTMRDLAFQMYFSNPAYLSMIEHKFGSLTLQHVKQMTTYHLPRDLLIKQAAE